MGGLPGQRNAGHDHSLVAGAERRGRGGVSRERAFFAAAGVNILLKLGPACREFGGDGVELVEGVLASVQTGHEELLEIPAVGERPVALWRGEGSGRESELRARFLHFSL